MKSIAKQRKARKSIEKRSGQGEKARVKERGLIGIRVSVLEKRTPTLLTVVNVLINS